MNRIMLKIGLELKVLIRLWPLLLPPLLTFGCVVYGFLEAGLILALGLAALSGLGVLLFCLFVGMAATD